MLSSRLGEGHGVSYIVCVVPIQWGWQTLEGVKKIENLSVMEHPLLIQRPALQSELTKKNMFNAYHCVLICHRFCSAYF